ncbi:glutathione S-transferase family protein [Gilvimarinus polysaccharolyticus]|uniref:glutathione S-transferase family protein n=1 Tax=Gilvimarinus polysaccharolyticus TaxID=863921 RepID=UPI0006735D44|nr:glutathione S-transferase family protein [Gilvimarinus polysaccharolyticus]
MGLLIDGIWHDQWYDTKTSGGKFIRSEAQYRHWITPDGSAGATGTDGFKAEPGRYHLYVSLACPWAHRTLILRTLKGLEEMIGVSVVNPLMREHGWSFASNTRSSRDQVYQADFLHQLYTRDNPNYSGRVTVPLLWDKQRERIVNNESADIVRILNSGFDHIGALKGDYYPIALQTNIDEINHQVYHTINNGVYKAGFATEQSAYDEAVTTLFDSLDKIEALLAQQRYLTGGEITEADWRLFTTLIRFDAVYHGHFKCNLKRIVDYPNLWAYTRELYQWPGVAKTVNFDHIKEHYYRSHTMINPTAIIPNGPLLELNAPHGRDTL